MYEVIVLKEGYSRPEQHGRLRACGSVTLVKGSSKNIIVDTGSPWDKEAIIKGLAQMSLNPSDVTFVICTSGKIGQTGNLNLFPQAVHVVGGDVCEKDLYHLHSFRESLQPEDIQYVVCTHGHSDHVGNLNLFTRALHVVSYDICRGDEYIMHDFKQGIPYEIDDKVEIWPTPGHTGRDVSVIVKDTNFGTVAITGDLFECESDLETPSLWQENSEQPRVQEQSRIEILDAADYIIPGHGSMFQVPKECKRQLRVVMVSEEHFHSGGVTTSTSECIIVETD